MHFPDYPIIPITTPYGAADMVVEGAGRVRVHASRARGRALTVFRVEYEVSAVLKRMEGRWVVDHVHGTPRGGGKGWDLSRSAERELCSRLPLVVEAHLQQGGPDLMRRADLAHIQFQRGALVERTGAARDALEKAQAELDACEITERELAVREEVLRGDAATGAAA